MGAVRYVDWVTVTTKVKSASFGGADYYEVRVGNSPTPLNNPTCPGIHSGSKIIKCGLSG